MVGNRFALVAAIATTILLSLPAATLARDAGGPDEGPLLLVALVPGASASDVARAHGARLVTLADGGRLAVLEAAAGSIARDPRVLSVEADGRVRSVAGAGASWDGASWDGASWDGASWDGASWDGASWDAAAWSAASIPWSLAAIRAPLAWELGIPSLNRIVCVVDSGIDATHPLLAARLWRDGSASVGRDFVDDDNDPEDAFGHGTHMAGIIAASPAPNGFRGAAAPAIASARVLGADGLGSTSDVIAALEWCSTIGADVALLALSEDAPTNALARAIRSAQSAGILVIASAGNAGPCEDCVSYPAAYPGVLAVGAMDPDGTLADYSSMGRQVSLVAPGSLIVSTFPGGGYRSGSGTSQAAALAAGVAALVWAQNPGLDAGDVSRILLKTARDDGDAGKDRAWGAGLLDAAAASAQGVSA